MPKLTESEITERGRELAALECQLSDERGAFAKKRKAHTKNVDKLKDRIEKVSREIDDEYTDGEQSGLPGIGSGPDEPEDLPPTVPGDHEATERMARDVGLDPDDAPHQNITEYTEGWDAFNNDEPTSDNPYTGAGEEEARRRAAWNEGYDAAEDEATKPEGHGEEPV